MSISPRANKIMIFYTERDNSFWIIPTEELLKISKVKHLGRVTFNVPTDSDEVSKLSIRYKNDKGFELIKSMRLQ
ncbi:hypothetical protein SAMN05443246_5912 [Paenibacillus sp. GP183]|nr:hypothetical protein SAMN05443246_5912 [Paenibacillus sp. GP183]